MKKYLYIWLLAIPFLFSACDKDNEDLRRIEGSIFAAYTGYDSTNNADQYTVYRFYSNTEVERTERQQGPKGLILSTSNGTYTTTEDNITININGTVTGDFIDDNSFRIGDLEFNRQ